MANMTKFTLCEDVMDISTIQQDIVDINAELDSIPEELKKSDVDFGDEDVDTE